EYARDLSLTLYQLADGAATTTTLVDERGQTYVATVKRKGSDVHVAWDRGLPWPWSVQVAGQAKQAVAAGRAEHSFRLS
ncbi:MAG TPA: hypothetical protein VIM69_07790, partial [Opitutaceae bacterium]